VQRFVEPEGIAHSDHRYTGGATQIPKHLPDKFLKFSLIDHLLTP
jgi:hypothetical protein